MLGLGGGELPGAETALPAIARRLTILPDSKRAFVFLEVADSAEEQPLPSLHGAPR
ncbi:SIP domain-containing protein [Microvirga brassicacearum]|uniref:Siderophore-interacting protein n=1 Tax=Microvirga brassicacearum TaxID=2580413 RepID=A0A5N3PDQ2_9HYPH|nr:siderophore-interacting protein [Microvirga brassicacearum]